MKTIEEACMESYSKEGYSDLYAAGKKSGFEEGAAFLQKWIPVEEELPPCDMKILFKDVKDDTYLKEIYSSEYFADNEIIKEYCHIRSFILWRPIEHP